MTKRERMLSIAVGSIVAVMGVLYLFNWFSGAFESRADDLTKKSSEIVKQKRDILLGKEAAIKLKEFEDRSLPANGMLAGAEYGEWLADLASVKIGFDAAQVRLLPSRKNGDLYLEHRFLVDGYGDLEQVVSFLYEFHRTDYIHRLGQINMSPVKGSNLLKVSLRADCLSLNKSKNEELPVLEPSERLTRDKATYIETIAHRNPFAPANKAPTFAELGTQRGNPNTALTIQTEATDANERDKLKYELVDEPILDAKIDPATGRLEVTPTATGEFEMLVRVTDNGLPRLSDELLVKISVSDPPPPTQVQELDPATQAFVTGITEAGSTRIVHIQVRTEGRALLLREGDRVAVGTVQGVIVRIELLEAEIETDDGQTIKVALGHALVRGEA